MILRSVLWRVNGLYGIGSLQRATFATKEKKGWTNGRIYTAPSKSFTTSRLQQAQDARGHAPAPDAASPYPDVTPQSPKPVSNILRDTEPEHNNLLSPVHIPEDPNGILNERHPATKILANSAIVVQRQLEMMNIMLGFEQANRYTIMDPQGNHLGYMAEQELGMGNMMARQWFRTHRSFTTHVFDREMKEVLRV